MSRYLSPRYGHVMLVSTYNVLTAANWPQHGCGISCCNLPHQVESVRFHIGYSVVWADGWTVWSRN